MSLDVGSLVAYLTVDDDQAKKGLKDGETQFRRYGTTAEGVGRDVHDSLGRSTDTKKTRADLDEGQSLFKTFGKTAVGVAGSIGAAFAALRIASFVKDAISTGSDLAETTSKVERIFGDASKAVEQFALTADTGLGQSQQAALDAAATFALFGKGAGLTGDALAGFSTGLVTLAGDLASFSNTSPAEAAEALGAALRGESEPLRAFGVLLDANVIAAAALSHGIVKSKVDVNELGKASFAATDAQRAYDAAVAKSGRSSEDAAKAGLNLRVAQQNLAAAFKGSVPDLTKQQTVLATQAAILDQTKDAQGDFARTSTGLANQQRILNAEWDNAKASLGTTLLPLAVQFAHVLTGMAAGLKENQAWLVPLVVTLGSLATVIYLITSAAKAWTVVQWLLNIALDANPIGLVIIAIGLLVAGIALIWMNSAGFRDFFIGMWADIVKVAKSVGSWFAGPFVDFFVGVGHAISSAFKAVVNQLVDLINSPLVVLNGTVIALLNKIPGVHIGLIPLVPHMAAGGIVPATPGGRLIVAGEAGQDEAVIPLGKLQGMGGGGGTLHVVISGTGILRGLRGKGRAGGGRSDTVFVGGAS